MNNRLQRFLDAENITQSQLAETLGVAKASISHILAGRNKPGFDFIQSMSQNYPDLNLDWLIAGKGKMYKSQASQPSEEPILPAQSKDSGRLFESQEPDLFPDEPKTFENKAQAEQVSPSESKPDIPRITKILVFYDNGTFKELD
ncbi:MAG TPA: hypothetical protein DDX40_01735 [Rikenellaceae bacterium]|nr:hypothetical protein [Rikenellaceae bacterium]